MLKFFKFVFFWTSGHHSYLIIRLVSLTSRGLRGGGRTPPFRVLTPCRPLVLFWDIHFGDVLYTSFEEGARAEKTQFFGPNFACGAGNLAKTGSFWCFGNLGSQFGQFDKKRQTVLKSSVMKLKIPFFKNYPTLKKVAVVFLLFELIYCWVEWIRLRRENCRSFSVLLYYLGSKFHYCGNFTV